MVAAVPVACPSCDVVPPSDATAGAACAACGTPLVERPITLPPEAFAPPVTKHAPVELEGEWTREKAARIAAATTPRPPAKSAVKLGGIAIAVAMVAIVTVVVAIIARAPSTTPPKASTTRSSNQQLPATANLVSIEVRSRPRGVITFDGHAAGNTPLTVHVPKSTKSIEIGATLAGHHKTRIVIPDRDQTIDFTYP